VSYVDSVTLRAEEARIPPEHVLVITGHPGTEHSPGDELSITVSAYDETSEGSTETTVAYFHLAADDLYAALDLVLGHSPVRHPDEVVA
jgi:hypothetical protein